MSYPLFMQPVFKERIWGGSKLRDQFSYEIPSEQTGECWGISAHPHGQSIVQNGPFAGWDLHTLWEKKRLLFGHSKGKRFPLLTKILDANQDLSIQVHPNDEYAQRFEAEESGKTECWYIIDCDENAEVIYGHTAQTKIAFEQKFYSQERDQLFRRRKINPGDFFYVPSGTLHALGKGTLVLETQQNSDLTYRVYDYDRMDESGKKRELHIKKALDVMHFPHIDSSIKPITHIHQATQIVTYIRNKFFTVQKWITNGRTRFIQNKNFLLVSVLSGDGQLEGAGKSYSFYKGDHVILPYGISPLTITGKAEWIVSYID